MYDDICSVNLNDKNVVLFGGSFNPIHNGHLNSIKHLMKTHIYDFCIFVPVSIPVHKDSSSIISANHRMEMIRLAVKDLDFAIVSDIEIKRGGRSYTIDTVDQIKSIYPKIKLNVVFSDDLLEGLSSWKEIDRLCNSVNMICMTRNESHCQTPYKVDFFQNPIFTASSTEIRERIKKGQNISDLVPKNVSDYINLHHLYQ